IHASGIDHKTGHHGLLEHPLECNLGKAALGFRITAADIFMNARKPDLLEIQWSALWWRAFRHPEVRTEEGAAFGGCERGATNLEVGIVTGVRQPQRIFIPAD